MGLAKEDIELIQQMIDSSFKQLDSAEPILSNVRYDLELRERTVRVEEELKRQRDLMLAGFAQMDKRFELIIEQFDKRSEQVDKRFEGLDKHFDLIVKQFDKRFEDMDKHFDLIVKQFDKRFEQVDKRFEQVDKRFEQVDKRFEQVDKHFEQVDKRFEQMHVDMTQGFMEINRRLDRFMYWSLAMFISLAGVIKFF